MDIRTADDKAAAVEALLNEARIEADILRMRLEWYRRIIASTRLIMGHELKKPTSAICGYLDLAREDIHRAGMTEALKYVDKAREECDLLSDLNAFYLDLITADGGSGVPGAELVDVPEVIHEAIAQLPAETGRAGRLDVRVATELPMVSVNRNALKLVVLNLLENALNYSPASRGVRIEVEASKELRGVSEGELLKIRVTDEGTGISAEDIKRIFMPFVRLDDAVVKGSGLGLTLVRSLVDMCGGEVSVKSEPGEGTTVYVTLPLSSEDPWAGVVLP